MTKARLAERMADLTFELFENCQLKIERTAEHLDLTVAEFKVLRSMRSDEMLSAGELAKRVRLSSSRLTRILDGLVAKGFVRRQCDTRDRRVVEVLLTDEGRKMRSDLRAMFIRTHQDIVDILSSDTGESVIVAMEKLGDAMKEGMRQ
ncbi:MAG: MarR family transcriptional regulator [Ignavibacteria bacterium]|nr:MarR family transcriptional regulator [Ignavibacteria bacterium]